ncbi:MAG: T9SS type A sorting domain-containing protein [Bacteroidetes bacterium]|nr:T9SS type A sorting domain-containing protein [Bacteroidota bacterium]
MKKIIYISIFLFSFTIKTNAQSLVDTNKLWSVVEGVFGGNSMTFFCKFQGDTVLGSHFYRKLYNSSDSSMLYWYYAGAMREDSAKKVFYITYQNEYLYYDFGLNQNDTFISVLDQCPVQLVVDSVDSVPLLNGEMRKRMFLSNSEIWVDGMGSLFGLTHVAIYNCMFDAMADLNCLTEDQVLKYDNPAYPACYYTTVGIEKINSSPSWSLSPNPFKDFATITFHNSGSEPGTLKIFDEQGRLIKSIFNITTNHVVIDRAGLQNGFYFFQLTNEKHLVANGKLIIQ